MTAADVAARVRRLEQPSLCVARETQLVGESDIFLYCKRRESLDALHRMCGGLESARVALAKAPQWLHARRRAMWPD
jgi:hypothetical protein